TMQILNGIVANGTPKADTYYSGNPGSVTITAGNLILDAKDSGVASILSDSNAGPNNNADNLISIDVAFDVQIDLG
ncbi:hypothetical protein TI05_17910, partial [Achromatium sp. WMS3]